MKICLIPIGDIHQTIIDMLRDQLSLTFCAEVFSSVSLPIPAAAYNRQRCQYDAEIITNFLTHHPKVSSYDHLLGIIDRDLYVPHLNFVFGLAIDRVAIISILRFRQEFYGLPIDDRLFSHRTIVEGVHELGHTLNLDHCSNPTCVMCFSNSILDTDRKSSTFCSGCQNLLLKRLTKTQYYKIERNTT